MFREISTKVVLTTADENRQMNIPIIPEHKILKSSAVVKSDKLKLNYFNFEFELEFGLYIIKLYK